MGSLMVVAAVVDNISYIHNATALFGYLLRVVSAAVCMLEVEVPARI